MASVETICQLLSRLSLTDNKIEILNELKTLTTLVPYRDLRDIIPNISIGSVFDCLNTNDKSQQTACGEILNSMLSTLSPTTVLENFSCQLFTWLSLPGNSAKSSCLKQLTRLCKESPYDLCQHRPLVTALVGQLSSDNIEVGLAASTALTHLGKDVEGLNTLFSAEVVDRFLTCLETNEIVRFRVYQLAIDLSSRSPSALQACANAGLLQQLVNETLSDGDILVQLNAIELVSDLARCPHGLDFLDGQGVVTKMESLIGGGLDGNPMAGILMPGLIKFYGGLARCHPKEVLSKFPRFVHLVINSIQENEPSLSTICMDTVALIATNPDGKLALDRLGNPMTECVRAIGTTVRQGLSEAKGRALEALASLTYLQVEHQTTELLSVTQRWFQAANSDSFNAVWSITQQPFSDVRVPALHALQSVAMTPWGQRSMNSAAGFKEYLLDRATENTKEGKEEKFELVRILAESPTCIDILSRPFHVKLREYVNQGPFFVLAQSQVAMEGET